MAYTRKPAFSRAPKQQWRRFVSDLKVQGDEQTRRDLREVLLGNSEPVTPERAWAILDAPGSSLGGDHHDGSLARLTFPHVSRDPGIVARLRAQGMAPGRVLVPQDGLLWREAQTLWRL